MPSLRCTVDLVSFHICSIRVSPGYLSSSSRILNLFLVIGLQTTHLSSPNYVSTSIISSLQVVCSEFFWSVLFFLTSPSTQCPSNARYLQYSTGGLGDQTQISTCLYRELPLIYVYSAWHAADLASAIKKRALPSKKQHMTSSQTWEIKIGIEKYVHV